MDVPEHELQNDGVAILKVDVQYAGGQIRGHTFYTTHFAERPNAPLHPTAPRITQRKPLSGAPNIPIIGQAAAMIRPITARRSTAREDSGDFV
jgi:hypothetical protein